MSPDRSQAIPDDMMEKATLPALGYTSVQEALGEKFHAAPSLLQALNPGKTFAAGEEIVVPNVLGDATLAKADKVVVDQSDATVSLVDATGQDLRAVPRDDGQRTRSAAARRMEDPRRRAQSAVPLQPRAVLGCRPDAATRPRSPPGPNNPVGVVWIDLSKEHYGIHGTPVAVDRRQDGSRMAASA